MPRLVYTYISIAFIGDHARARARVSARENGGSSKLFFMTRQQKESQPGPRVIAIPEKHCKSAKQQDFIDMLAIVGDEGEIM